MKYPNCGQEKSGTAAAKYFAGLGAFFAMGVNAYFLLQDKAAYGVNAKLPQDNIGPVLALTSLAAGLIGYFFSRCIAAGPSALRGIGFGLAGGVLLGALTGTCVLPVTGTLLGAGAGAALGLLCGPALAALVRACARSRRLLPAFLVLLALPLLRWAWFDYKAYGLPWPAGAKDAAWYEKQARREYARHSDAKALENLARAIELDPGYAGAYIARGIIYADKGYLDRGQYQQAISDFSKAIELAPGSAAAYALRAGAYAGKGEHDPAIADYTRSLRLDPKDPDVYIGRAKSCLDTGAYDQAVEDCDRALILSPGAARAYRVRGQAYAKTGEQGKAAADYKKAESLEAAFWEYFIPF
ncbi:MAG TPA: tetratricopeptide repeat protein [Elusimicrobiales bacterium]|nr:tetratricopeptide repeat protein [Elusimicrobiales bacterium]